MRGERGSGGRPLCCGFRVAATLVSALVLGGCGAVRILPRGATEQASNLGFEGGISNGYPSRWGPTGEDTHNGRPTNYAFDIDRRRKASGSFSARLRFTGDDETTWVAAVQCIDARKYRRAGLRLTGSLKTEKADGEGASLWLTVYDVNGKTVAFQNMDGRRVRETRDWSRQRVQVDVPSSATHSCFGFLLGGRGVAWADDLSLSIRDAGQASDS